MTASPMLPTSFSSQSSIQAIQVSEKVIQLVRDVSHTTISEIDVLKNALENEKDVTDRIQDILSEKNDDKQQEFRQLREITAYLKIAEMHLQDQPQSTQLAKNLHALIKKINSLIKISPAEEPWKTLVHAIDEQIALDRNKTQVSPVQKTALEHRASHTISGKNFAHIHAESFITHTSLEGNSKATMLDCFTHYCQQLSSSSAQKQKLIALCKETLELINQFELDRAKSPELIDKIKKPFCTAIQNKLQALKPGESLLLPSGWAKISGSHAMYLLTTKEQSGKFDVKLFNNGMGIDSYHSKIIEDEQFKFQPYIHVKDIDEASVGADAFLTALLEIQTVGRTESGKTTDYGEKDVYEALISGLGGTRVLDPPHFSQFMIGQLSGNCTWASLMAVAMHFLGAEEFSRAAYEIKLNSLIDFFNTADLDHTKNILLLQTSAELFAGSLLTFYKQGIISLNELNEGNEALKQIFARVEKKRHHLEFVQGHAQILELKDTEHVPLHQGGVVPQMKSTERASQENLQRKKNTPAPYTDFSWTKDPSKFLAGAKEFERWCLSLPMFGTDPEILKLSTIRFYENLAMPDIKEGFWDRIPPADIIPCMQTIANISDFIFCTADRESVGLDHYVTLQAGALKSLAVVKNLALLSNSLPGELLSGTLPWRGFKSGFFGTDWSGRPKYDSNIYNVVLRQEVVECIKYLNETEDKSQYYPKRLFIFSFNRLREGISCEFGEQLIEHLDRYSDAKEVNYVYQLLQNPDVREKFYLSHPKARQMPEWRQLVLALGDLQGEWLPPAFAALKKQSFLSLAASLAIPIVECYSDAELGLRRSENKEKISLFTNPCKEPPSYEDLKDETLCMLVDKSRSKEEGYQPYFTESLAKAVDLRRINSRLTDKEISIKEARELMAVMAAGEYDAKDPHLEMQVIRTLSHFLSHKEKMQIPKYQALFRLLVFEGNHLEKLLEINPAFKNTLQYFIQRQMEFFRDKGDINSLCFIVECSRHFQVITAKKMGSDQATGFMDPIQYLTDLAAKNDLTTQEKALVCKHLAASFATHGPAQLTEAQVITVLASMTFIRTHPESSLAHSSHLKSEYESLLKIYGAEIEKHIKGPAGSTILNAVAHLAGIAVRNDMWSLEEYPSCRSKDETITLDLDSGAIYNKNQSTSVLPSAILNHPRFSQLFPRKDYIACKSAEDVYEFMDDTSTPTRIIVDKAGVIFQKELVKGQWFQLQDTIHYSAATLQSLGGETLVKGYHLWSSSQGNHTTILAMDQDRTIAHRWLCSLAPDNKQEIKVDAVEKVMADGQVLSLAKKEFPLLEVWSPLLWCNPRGEPVLLELSQIGQQFTMKKEKNAWIATSKDYPGLKLCANQHVKGWEEFKNKIVLEDGKGNRKVLIPQLELQTSEAGALTKTLTQKFDIDEKPISMIFDIDPKKGVLPGTKVQQLYHAYIELGLKNYRKAQEILRNTYSKAVPYTDEERDILKKIISLKEETYDGDPRACAVSMTALSLLLQDKPLKLSNQADASYLRSIIEQYHHYAGAEAQIGTSKLTTKEEISILTFLTEYSFDDDWIDLRLEKYQIDIPSQLQRHRPEKKASESFSPVRPMNRSEFWAFCKNLNKAHDIKPRPTLLTRPGKSFVNEFFDGGLYQKIKEHSLEARLQLNFAKADYDVDRQLLNILELVWQFPDQFPDSREFIDIFFCQEVDEFNKIIESIKEKVVKTNETRKGGTLATRSKASRVKTQSDLQAGPAQVRAIKALPPILTSSQQTKFFKDVPFVGIALEKNEIKDLQDALDLKATGALGDVKTKEIQEDVRAAWEHQAATRPFVNPDQIGLLKTSLLVQQAEQKKLLVDQTQRLLALANELPVDVQQKLHQDIAWKATLVEPITFNDLCILIANKDFQRLKDKNAGLDDAKINLLYNSMLQVLERGKLVQKIDRSLSHIADLQKQIEGNQGKDTQGLSQDPYYLDVSQKLQFDLTRPIAYKVDEDPEYSLFEFIANMQLYQDQTRDLDVLVKVKGPNDNVVLQKIMGKGKSKVYLPILALKKADGNTLPVIVVTGAQYATTLKDMEASSGQIFHQVTHTLTFDRGTDCSLQNLQKIQKDLDEIIHKKQYIVVTDKTVHCLINKCKEMSLDYMSKVEQFSKTHPGEACPAMPAELQEMRKILAIIKNGVLDEADLLLNSKHEVNFTMGEPEDLDHHHAAVVSELFESIYSNQGIMALITSKNTESTNEPVFTLQEYNTTIKPKIATAFIAFAIEHSTHLGKYFSTLSAEDQANIYDYLMNGDKGDAFVANLTNIALQDALAIAKEEINEILPITLRKVVNFHYGFSPVQNEHVAIPFVGNTRPSDTSRFGNPYELLSYTTQLYCQLGIPETKIRELTDAYKAQAIKEMSADPSLDVTRTSVYSQFKELCGEQASYNLMRLSDQDMTQISSRFKKDRKALFKFMRTFVFPQVKIYPGKISSNHLTLVDTFESVIGFTGTPWNKDTYHKRIQTLSDKGTDGKTLGILWKNSRNNVHVLKGSDITTILDQLFKNMGPNSVYRTLKDSGALFNWVDNETVARDIMTRLPPHIKGVKFYNKENRLVLLERGKLVAVEVEQSLLSPEECFTYYDQWNTTGKDVKQMANARGFVTIGKTLTRRDLLQCVWRFRELDKGQVAELVIPPEVVDLISKEFNIDAKEASSLNYILKFVELNQLRELEKQILTCTYHAIHHVVENAIDKMISKPGVDLSQLELAIPHLNRLLNISTKDKPYEQFGRKEKEELTTVVMQRRIDAELALVKPLLGTHPIFDTLNLKHLKAEMEKAIPWELLPKRVPTLNRSNRDLTVEIEREAQRVEELNMQRLKEMESQREYADKRATVFDHWNWTDATQDQTMTSLWYFSPTAVDLVIKNYGAANLHSAPMTFHPLSTGIPPVMTLSDIFRHAEGLETYADVFDLDVTFNFLPPISGYIDLSSARGSREYALPFDRMQADVKNMLMVRDKDTNRLKLILIDSADAGYFYSALRDEKKKEESKKEQSVALIEMNLGVIQAESSRLEHETESAEWLRLIVQAKFFHGEVVYNKQEQKYLEEWIKAKGPARMEKLFYTHILRHKPEVKPHYPQSILGRLFNDLQQ